SSISTARTPSTIYHNTLSLHDALPIYVSSNTRETNEVKHEKTIKEPVNRTSTRQAENQSSSMNGNSTTATSPNTNAQSQTKDDDSSNDDSMSFNFNF